MGVILPPRGGNWFLAGGGGQKNLAVFMWEAQILHIVYLCY